MATARKHWLRLYESILDEDWDDATLAAVVRLMCFLNRRWARNGVAHEDAGKATIPMQELCSLMRRSKPDVALRRLRTVAEAVTMRIQVGATSVEIDWPKFAKLQEYGPRKAPGDRAVTSLSDSDSDTKKKKKKNGATAPPAAPPEMTGAEASPPEPAQPELTADAARAKLELDTKRALNVLADQEGGREEKRLWLLANLRKCEAWCADQQPRVSTRSGLLRWWTRYVAGDKREFREKAEHARTLEQMRQLKRERGITDPPAQEPEADPEMLQRFMANNVLQFPLPLAAGGAR